jgi:hypothetical protein
VEIFAVANLLGNILSFFCHFCLMREMENLSDISPDRADLEPGTKDYTQAQMSWGSGLNKSKRLQSKAANKAAVES